MNKDDTNESYKAWGRTKESVVKKRVKKNGLPEIEIVSRDGPSRYRAW
jgi:hypothetical protein